MGEVRVGVRIKGSKEAAKALADLKIAVEMANALMSKVEKAVEEMEVLFDDNIEN